MQRGHRYLLVEPIGSNFDPDFKPELTPKQMLSLGVFGGKYITDGVNEFPSDWFAEAKLSPRRHDASQLFRCLSRPVIVDLAPERVDTPRRPARLVSVVLPLLLRTQVRWRRCTTDQTMESDAAPRASDPKELRAL